jgi:hypothetical protein
MSSVTAVSPISGNWRALPEGGRVPGGRVIGETVTTGAGIVITMPPMGLTVGGTPVVMVGGKTNP